eukprot:167127-Rhodomonas_salina.2
MCDVQWRSALTRAVSAPRLKAMLDDPELKGLSPPLSCGCAFILCPRSELGVCPCLCWGCSDAACWYQIFAFLLRSCLQLVLATRRLLILRIMPFPHSEILTISEMGVWRHGEQRQIRSRSGT